MAEVGILNLQIHDNSAKAAEGLGRLASALNRVKSAVSSGLKLGNIGTQIEKINSAISHASSGGTIENLNGLASALKRVKEASDGIQMPNLRFSAKSGKQGIETTAERIRQTAREIQSEFETVGSRIEEINTEAGTFAQQMERVNELVQNTTWSAGGMEQAFKNAFSAWSKMRSSMTLGGSNQARLGAGTGDETGWSYFNPFGETTEKGWEEWKNGAIETEYTISDAMDNIENRLTETAGFYLEAGEQIVDAVSEMDYHARDAIGQGYDSPEYYKNVHAAVEELKKQQAVEDAIANAQARQAEYESLRAKYMSGEGPEWVKQGILNKYGISETALVHSETLEKALSLTDEDIARIESVNAQIEEIFNTLNNSPKFNLAESINRQLGIGQSGKSAQDSATAFMEAFEKTDGLTEAEEMLQKMTPDLNDTSTAFSRFRDMLIGAGEEGKTFADKIQGVFPRIAELGKQLERIATRMLLRSVIKEITKGFKEGIENLYFYSKAVGTDFAPAMNSAASAMLQFKNSIGAAVAPVIQALIPVLQTVVDWVITAVNYLNQFLALISGRSGWTKALPVAADAFEETGKKAKKAGGSAKEAAKEVKELLADWDELNIIQSESGGNGGSGGGGGGAGSTAADYKNMFTEVAGFNDQIKAFTNNLKNQFGSILELVKEVGAVVLAWKFSKMFSGIVGTLASFFGAAQTIKLTFDITKVFDNTFVDTGEAGWLVGSIITPMLGSFFATKILSNVLDGTMAKIAIPITFAVSAFADLETLISRNDVSALSREALGLSIASALKMGTSFGFLTYLGGVSTLQAIGVGTAAAIGTLGVAIGLKATKDAIDTGSLNAEVIKQDILSASLVGLSIGAAEAALGGTLAGVLMLAGGGAIVTLGLLIGTQALLARPSKIAWGNYDATQEEIKAFVESEVFTVNPRTNIELINPKIEAVSQNEQELTATADEIVLAVNKIKLGYDETTALKELEKQIFGEDGEVGDGGLMGKFKKTVEAKKTLVETGITILFSNGKNDDGTAKELIDENNESWKAVTDHMSSLGEKLSQKLEQAYNTSLSESTRQMAVESVEQLTGMIAKVTYAMTQGEAWANAQINLRNNLDSLTSGSFEGVLDYIEQYKQEVVEGTKATYDAVTKEKAGLMLAMKAAMENALDLAGGDTEDKDYKYYKKAYERARDQYNSWRDGRDDAIKDAMEDALNSETMNMIRETLLGKLKGKAGESDVFVAFDDAIRTNLKESIDSGSSEMAGELIQGMLDSMIRSYFGRDSGIILKMMDMGLLNYGDVISEEAIETLKKQMFLDKDAGELWDELIQNLFTPPNGGSTPDFIDEETFSSVEDVITDMMEDSDWQHMTDDEFRKLITSLKDSFGEENVNKAIEGFDIPLSDLKIEPPNIDPVTETMEDASSKVSGCVNDIKDSLSELNGLSFSANFNVSYGKDSIKGYATGGVVRAADLFMANENGNIEMMGKMGNQTVVANNQQIVEGISRGVAQSNNGMAADMSMMVALMRQFLSKELTAKVVPSASMGRSNYQSNLEYDKVHG